MEEVHVDQVARKWIWVCERRLVHPRCPCDDQRSTSQSPQTAVACNASTNARRRRAEMHLLSREKPNLGRSAWSHVQPIWCVVDSSSLCAGRTNAIVWTVQRCSSNTKICVVRCVGRKWIALLSVFSRLFGRPPVNESKTRSVSFV